MTNKDAVRRDDNGRGCFMSTVKNLPIEVLHACLHSVRRPHLRELDYQRENVVLETTDVESASKVQQKDVVRRIVDEKLGLVHILERLEGLRVELLQAQLSRYLRGACSSSLHETGSVMAVMAVMAVLIFAAQRRSVGIPADGVRDPSNLFVRCCHFVM